MPDPMIGPPHLTLLDPDQTCWTFGLLFEPSAPLTHYLIIPLHIIIRPTPDSACLQTSAPLRSIILFILLPYLPYLCLPACIRFLVPDSDSCPYSSDPNRTSYMYPLF